MGTVTAIAGHVAPGFEAVRTAFAGNFKSGGEVGASLCVWHKGECVVDVWGGYADKTSGQLWERDTLSIIFSSTKGLAAMVALYLTDQGALELDRPVADYWPEFAANGKGDITVRTLLNHRSGLLTVETPLSLDMLEDLDTVARAIAPQRPEWTPDSQQGYHAITYGLYLGELVRRVADGRSLGQVFAEHVAAPVEADAYIGLPEAHEPRVARLYPASTKTRLLKIIPRAVTGLTLEGRVFRAMLAKQSHTHIAFKNPAELGFKGVKNFDTKRVRQMELPWANGVANARSLARVYARLIGADATDGNAFVRRETWGPIQERQSWQDKDAVLLKPIGWSQGFVKDELHLFSPNSESFGHPGAGGNLGWADPVENLAVGYVMNSMDFHLRSPRALAICHALYDSIGAQKDGRNAA